MKPGDVEQLLYDVNQLITRFRATNEQLVRMRDDLHTSVYGSDDLRVSADGNGGACEFDFGPAASEPEALVGTAGAAEILECSTRRVTQIARDLDGQRIGKSWIFQRDNVIAYRDRKES